MATFVYRRASSTSARSLADAVEGFRLRRTTTSLAQGRRVPVRGDVVVCWGEAAPAGLAQGVLILNGGPIRNKFTDAQVLRQAGVQTIEVSQTRPAAARPVDVTDPAIALFGTAKDLAEDFVEIESINRTVMPRGVQELITAFTALNGALARPIPTAAPASTDVWLPRMNSHVGGDDLLTPPATPEYYSKKLNLRREYRVHSFDGRSIRAGEKRLREGYTVPGGPGSGVAASAWIRSFDGGWRIVYDGFESSTAMRELAASAVTALGLQFGAVDIGELTDGRLVVLEVNRAPGLEGGSVSAYANALTRYISEHGTPEVRRNAA